MVREQWLVVLWCLSESLREGVTHRGRVALQSRVHLAQTEQIALLQETCFNPHGVQSRSSVTL